MPRRCVSVGHVARDEFADGAWRMGGTALYGAATLARLGRETLLVTRVGDREAPAFAAKCAELGITLVRLPSVSTTTFVHRFRDGRRELTLRARTRAIGAHDLRGTIAGDDAVLLASVAGEHADGVFEAVAGRAVLVAQGELRAFDAFGRVRPAPWRRAAAILPHLRAAVLSEEDVSGDLSLPLRWARLAPVVVTQGERGATLLRGDERVRSRAFRPDGIADATGAGDAFAAGLLVALDEGAALEDALDFANCVASFCLEGIGVDGLADRARVEARLHEGERLPG